LLKLETLKYVLERLRLDSMQRPVRLDVPSRAVLRKVRVVVVLKKLRAAALKELRVVVLKKLKAVALQKLSPAALQKPSPAARERLAHPLPIFVAAGKRAPRPNRLLLLQAIISYLQSGIYEIKTDRH
jgi:hypothetical protein